VPGGAATVSTADFNGDGKPDLAVVWSGTSTSGVAILLGKGDGTFASEVSYPTGTLVYILAHERGGGLKLCPRIDLCFLGPPVALLTSCRLPPLG